MGAILGAIGGITIGLALKDWRGIGLLALAGAVGCGIAAQINQSFLLKIFTTQLLSSVVSLATWGFITGASFGAALGYLKKRRGD
jgi:hypothetical protein